ncbi:MAG: hypothetical protein IPK61_16100 [Saprospiraceae bacterium]|nr:hypothetical protein [Saprospiraceae bacterium]
MKKFSWSVWMLILMTSISCKTNTEKSEYHTKHIAQVPADFQSQIHAGMHALQAYRENKQADSKQRKELLDAAVIHFEKASQIDSTNQDLCFLLGNAYYLSSSYYRAMNAFEKYNRLWPGNAGVANNLRVTYREVAKAELYNENNPLSAKTFIDKSLSLNPNDLQTLELLGVSMARLSNFDTALIVLKQVIEKNPKAATAMTNASIVYTKMDMIEEAKKYIKMAQAIDPRLNNPMLEGK